MRQSPDLGLGSRARLLLQKAVGEIFAAVEIYERFVGALAALSRNRPRRERFS